MATSNNWLPDIGPPVVQDGDTSLPRRDTISFVGAEAVDDPTNERTIVTVTGGAVSASGAANLSGLRAVSSGSRSDRQPFFVDDQKASFVWKPLEGAGVADDGVNVIRPSDTLLGQPGRFYRDPQIATTAAPGVLGVADKLRLDTVARIVKPNVRAASVGTSLALSGALTLDGVALTTGDLVLAKDQSAPAANGIYRVNTAGAWTRWTEADAAEDFPSGYTVHVESGNRNRGSEWVLIAEGALSVGSSALRFVRVSGVVNMRDAGCRDDGEFDNSAIVNALIDASQNVDAVSRSAVVLYFPSDHGKLSNYRFLSPIHLPRWDYFAYLIIRGDGMRTTQLTGPDADALIKYHTINVAEMTGNPGLTFAGSGPGTVTRSSGSWIADGFTVGGIARIVGSVSNDYGRVITGVSATVLTFAEPLIAEGPTLGVSVTIANQNGCSLLIEHISLAAAPTHQVFHWDPAVSEEEDPTSLLMRPELHMNEVFCTRGTGKSSHAKGLIYIRRGHRCRFYNVESAGLMPDPWSINKTGAPTLTFAGAGPGTVTRSSGSWITDGASVGARVTISGTSSNNFTQRVLTGVSATVLTFAEAMTPEGPVASAGVSVSGQGASSYLYEMEYSSGTTIINSRGVGNRGGIAKMTVCGETTIIGARSEGATGVPALYGEGAGQWFVAGFTCEGTGEWPAIVHCKDMTGLNFQTIGLATPDIPYYGTTYGHGMLLENCQDGIVDAPLHQNSFSNLGDGTARAIVTDEDCVNIEIRGGWTTAESAYTDYDLQGTDVHATVRTQAAGVVAIGKRRADVISGNDGGTGLGGVEGKTLTLLSGKGANPETDANGSVRVDLRNVQDLQSAVLEIGHRAGPLESDDFVQDVAVSAVSDWSGDRALVEGDSIVFAGGSLALFARTPDGSLRAAVEQPSALTPASTTVFATGDAPTDTALENLRTRVNELELKLSAVGALYQGVPKSIFGSGLILDLNPFGFEDGELLNDGGTGPVFLQSDSGKRPILGSMNGRAALVFDGTDDFLQAATSWTGPTNACEVFVVMQLDGSAPGPSGNGLWRFGTQASGNYEVVPYSDNHVYEGFGTDTRKDAGAVPTVTMQSPCIYSVRSGPGAYSVHLNGTQLYSTATNTMAWQTLPALGGSGNDPSSPSIFHKGKIARVVLATGVNSPKRSAVLAYLAEYYGVTL